MYSMKTTKILALFAIMIAGLSIMTGCQKTSVLEEHKNELTENQLITEIQPVMEGFLEAQYHYALGKDTSPKWEQFILTGGKELQNRLDSDLRYLKAFKSHYSDYTSSVDFSSATITLESKEIVHIKNVLEKYTLTSTSEDGSSTTTKAHYPYDFSFQNIDGVWKILDWKEKHFLYPEGRWYSPDPEENLRTQELYKKQQTRSSSGYDREAAVDYALNHYNSPSTNYPNYTNYGGDCTNFVSQCLEAGGWSQTDMSIPRGSKKAWYHKRGKSMPATKYRSASWTSAKKLGEHLEYTDRVLKMSFPFYSYEKGDIVQDLNFTIGHSMIITDKREGKLFLTYRSVSGVSDSDVPISSFGRYTFWKIAD